MLCAGSCWPARFVGARTSGAPAQSDPAGKCLSRFRGGRRFSPGGSGLRPKRRSQLASVGWSGGARSSHRVLRQVPGFSARFSARALARFLRSGCLRSGIAPGPASAARSLVPSKTAVPALAPACVVSTLSARWNCSPMRQSGFRYHNIWWFPARFSREGHHIWGDGETPTETAGFSGIPGRLAHLAPWS